MDTPKKVKTIIDSFNYVKIYLEMNNCLFCGLSCDEKYCKLCVIRQAKRYLEIFTETTFDTYMIGGNNNEKI